VNPRSSPPLIRGVALLLAAFAASTGAADGPPNVVLILTKTAGTAIRAAGLATD
jgi:hypothetical protein